MVSPSLFKASALMPGARQDEGRGSDDDELEAILRRIAAGDRAAREWLFAQYRPRLAGIVRAKLSKRSPRALSDASDIVQRAMAVAAQRLDDFIATRPMPVFPWLYTLTRDQIGKAHKKHRATVSIDLADESADRVASLLADSGTTPSGNVARNEIRRMVQEAVRKLKSEHREILFMRYNEGLKLTEIAAILGVAESAARMRHLRAIEEMKGLIGHWGDEPTG
jgi:RNA polymerase sigma-70 factor (ECF subfamily)